MGAESRQKTAKKNESARTPRRVGLVVSNEYAPIKDDINKLWTSWVNTSNTSDLWRRVEQSGLDHALKKLSTYKPELAVITGLSSDDAANVNTVITEMCEMINCIRLAYVDNETEIFDSDEREKRYLTITCPTIIELWCEYSTFAEDFAVSFVQKGWLNSSEHRTLLASVTELASSCVKLLVLAVNVADYHNLDDADNLYKTAIKTTETASNSLQQFLAKVVALGENNTALDTLMELVGWSLFGLSHMTNKTIKAGIESRGADSSFEDHDGLLDNVNSLLTQLDSQWGYQEKKEETPPPAPVPDKKSKEAKPEQIPEEENKRTKDKYLEALLTLNKVYQKYSDDAWTAQRLPVIKGTAGVSLKYRMECYDQIGKHKVDACAMAQRKQVLDSLALTDEHTLHSDIFVIGPDALNCTCDVTIQFPIFSTKIQQGEIFLKVKIDGEWTDFETAEKVVEGDDTFMVFKLTKCEAFTAMSFSPRDALMVGQSGANYVSEDNGKVEVVVPMDCFTSDVTLGIKTIPFDKKEYESLFVGIVNASVAVEITPEVEDSQMQKSVIVQLPINDDNEDKDTELVIARCNTSGVVQVLDKKQMTIKVVDDGIYTVDVKGFWCVAVLRIKRIFLNMRESIKKEFLMGYGKKEPCNIVTYIDDVTRGNETQTFVMEVIEKRHVDVAVDSKKQFGMIEVKKSRSKDVLLKRGEQIMMVIDGQMRALEAMTDEEHTLCYLQGGANVVSMATELKRDSEKLPDAMLFYKQVPSETVQHSVAIMTRDLSELITDEIVARTGTNTMSDAKKDKDKEESASQILKMESLMSLARELTIEEGHSLGEQLGVKPGTIQQIKANTEKDPVAANFQILCNWRGRFARSTMADFLVSSLKAVGKINYADMVIQVRKYNRGLEKSDFESARVKGKVDITA